MAENTEKDAINTVNEKENGDVSDEKLENEKPEDDGDDKKFNIPDDVEDQIVKTILGEEESRPHPYQFLIDSFNPAEHQMIKCEVPTVEKSKIIEINTEASLKDLVAKLMQLKEISVHMVHCSKCYNYIICFILIGTDKGNYLIDSIKLKSCISQLTQVFINPKVVKIIYNDSILGYLQRELSLYLINVFEIRIARQVLGLPIRNHMQYVRQFCEIPQNILTNAFGEIFMKRPLEMTIKEFGNNLIHYLLNHYRELRNQLIAISDTVYLEVLERSNKKTAIVYKDYKRGKYLEAVDDIKNHHIYQWKLFTQLYKWRDQLAKKFNQNPEAILDRKNLERLVVANVTTETEITKITKSSYVQKDMEEILRMIKTTKTQQKTVNMLNIGAGKRAGRGKPQQNIGSSGGSVQKQVMNKGINKASVAAAKRRAVENREQSKRRRISPPRRNERPRFQRNQTSPAFYSRQIIPFQNQSTLLSHSQTQQQQDPNFINQLSENIIKIAANLSALNSSSNTVQQQQPLRAPSPPPPPPPPPLLQQHRSQPQQDLFSRSRNLTNSSRFDSSSFNNDFETSSFNQHRSDRKNDYVDSPFSRRNESPRNSRSHDYDSSTNFNSYDDQDDGNLRSFTGSSDRYGSRRSGSRRIRRSILPSQSSPVWL